MLAIRTIKNSLLELIREPYRARKAAKKTQKLNIASDFHSRWEAARKASAPPDDFEDWFDKNEAHFSPKKIRKNVNMDFHSRWEAARKASAPPDDFDEWCEENITRFSGRKITSLSTSVCTSSSSSPGLINSSDGAEVLSDDQVTPWSTPKGENGLSFRDQLEEAFSSAIDYAEQVDEKVQARSLPSTNACFSNMSDVYSSYISSGTFTPSSPPQVKKKNKKTKKETKKARRKREIKEWAIMEEEKVKRTRPPLVGSQIIKLIKTFYFICSFALFILITPYVVK